MTAKSRLSKLETQIPQAQPNREKTQAEKEAHERALNTLADALAEMLKRPITRADVDIFFETHTLR